MTLDENFATPPLTSHYHRQNETRFSNESDSYKSTNNETPVKKNTHEYLKTPLKDKVSSNKKLTEDSRSKRNAMSNDHENDERQKLLSDKKQSKKFYKTSIEKWRPVGDNKISCPRCQSLRRPTVRTQRQHITNSSLVSTFLMSCWPLCFSPCYLPEPKYENLYCPVCNYHLGVFDHQNKTVRSNPNLMQK